MIFEMEGSHLQQDLFQCSNHVFSHKIIDGINYKDITIYKLYLAVNLKDSIMTNPHVPDKKVHKSEDNLYNS